MKSFKKQSNLLRELTQQLAMIISETNGISLEDTLDLLSSKHLPHMSKEAIHAIDEFRTLLTKFTINQTEIEELLEHPVSHALYEFFRLFPLKYREEHTHLTGALSADFIYPRLKKLLASANGKRIRKQIEEVYGKKYASIRSKKDVNRLIRLAKKERFGRYLQILMLPKLILTSKEAHAAAAYHMANDMHTRYNIGHIRLKFMMSRKNSTHESEMIPGIEHLTPEDVVLGLYEGFAAFQQKHPDFQFILSPIFRKEEEYFDSSRFATKQEDIEYQTNIMLKLIEKHPKLRPHLCEIDTVGDEKYFYRKQHFLKMKKAFRKLQFAGFKIRSHHGETWKTLRQGIQAVDNAMNIWHIDTLEHGLVLGVNPNYYFHSLYQRVLTWNAHGKQLVKETAEYNEIMDMEWNENEAVCNKLVAGKQLNQKEILQFTKVKFHTAREVEHYQHDVLNRMISKGVSLVALPSSNFRLTHVVPDYKDHPFSWWEKKGVQLGVGTDNYITLDTDYIKELLILLFMDPQYLKITKLLMVATGERRRPYISSVLWDMRKLVAGNHV
ncbi:MAG TPA: hypothetical protein VJB65_05125 [Patescibacteria group bacterium]|nr:hypothetical protein [Patescibacteria group bacterium]